MSLTVEPLCGTFAAEVFDVDLSLALEPSVIADLEAAFWEYAVLVFPEQHLTQDQHVAFATQFGPIDKTVLTSAVADKKLRVREDIADVSNLDEDDQVWAADSRLRGMQLGNRLWHTDSSYKFVPALASLLYGLEIPPIGGNTEFADLRAAYDALDEDKKLALEGLVAKHSLLYSRARMGYEGWTDDERKAMAPVPQMMVRTIPQTGRKNLYIASHVGGIVGMDAHEANDLVDELLEHATQRQFVYAHRWRRYDLVMWDNRCCLHRGMPFDDLRFRRDVQRATVLDIANTCEQAGVPVPAMAAA